MPCLRTEANGYVIQTFSHSLLKQPLGGDRTGRDVGFVAPGSVCCILYGLPARSSAVSYRNQIGILEIRPDSGIPSVAI